MTARTSLTRTNLWNKFVVPWWRKLVFGWKHPRAKTGREVAQDSLVEASRSPSQSFDWVIDAFQMTIIAVMVTTLMIFVAAFFFSRPGLAEWIAGWFVQNCRVNGVCDFNANMAAFAVANVILMDFTVFFVMMLFWGWGDGSQELVDRLDELDSSDMEIVGQLGDLHDLVEEWRHERLPIPPEPDLPTVGAGGELLHEQPY